MPVLRTVGGRRCLEFKCGKPGCRKKPVRRYLDTADAKSTGCLHKHASKCWGEDLLKCAIRSRGTTHAYGTSFFQVAPLGAGDNIMHTPFRALTMYDSQTPP